MKGTDLEGVKHEKEKEERKGRGRKRRRKRRREKGRIVGKEGRIVGVG